MRTNEYVKAISQSTSYKDKLQELRELQSLPILRKIEMTRVFLTDILKQHKNPTIAWSGGKDSTVLLHLAISLMPTINVIWVNTGVEFPECMHFVRDLKNRWGINLHIAKPNTTFWEVVDDYGWPILGKGGNGTWKSRADYLERKGHTRLAKATREAKISAACCRLLKERPARQTYKQINTDCAILGNMVAESRQRFLNWAHRGDEYFSITEQRNKAWPLSYWKESDIWEYHSLFSIPYSSIYDKGHKRNGCWPCLMDIRYSDNKLSLLHQSHPKLWRFLILDKGLGKRILSLKLALDKDDNILAHSNQLDKYVKGLIREKPCYFDRL